MPNEIPVYELQRRKGKNVAVALFDSREQIIEAVYKFLDGTSNMVARDGHIAEEITLKITATSMDREAFDALPDWNGKE